MDPGTVALVLKIIGTIANLAPVAIEGFDDLKKFAGPLWRDITGGEMTPKEEAEIDAGLLAMSTELQAMRRPV